LREGRRLEKNGTDNRKNRRIQADTDSERSDGRGGESPILPEQAKRMANIPEERIHSGLDVIACLEFRKE